MESMLVDGNDDESQEQQEQRSFILSLQRELQLWSAEVKLVDDKIAVESAAMNRLQIPVQRQRQRALLLEKQAAEAEAAEEEDDGNTGNTGNTANRRRRRGHRNDAERLREEASQLRQNINRLCEQQRAHWLENKKLQEQESILHHKCALNSFCLDLLHNDKAAASATAATASISTIDGDGSPVIFGSDYDCSTTGYAPLLGRALCFTTHVSFLCLHLNNATTFLDENGRYWTESSIKVYAEPLIRFIRSSLSLRRVQLSKRVRTVISPLFPLLCEAAFQNNNVQELSLTTETVSLVLLQQHLPTTSLKKLDVSSWQIADTQAWEQQMIEDAFRGNSSLESLSINSNLHLARPILTGLANGRSNLQELEVADERTHRDSPRLDFVQALTAFLFAKKRLNCLTLRNFRFFPNEMVELVCGLRGPIDDAAAATTAATTAAAWTTVSKLILSACNWELGSLLPFRNFLQTRTGDEGLASPKSASLDELVLCEPNRLSYQNGHREQFTSADFVSMLAMQDENEPAEREERSTDHVPHWQSTIGSMIQSTSVFCSEPFYSDFLEGLADNVHRMRISKLHVHGLSGYRSTKVAALAECITKMESLRELSLSNCTGWYATNHHLVSSMKCSGNVRAISGYSGAHPRLVQAYCERNQFLHELLTPTTSLESGEEEHDDDDTSNDEKPNPLGQAGAAAADRIAAFLVPAVALAAEPVPNAMMRVLLQKITSLPCL